MKVRTKEVYNCEYCNKLYLVKSAAEKHEEMCFKNPANKRPCFECVHLIKKCTSVPCDYVDEHGEECERNLDLLYCSKKQTFLYTPKNEIKGNVFDLGEKGNEPMPKECDLTESLFSNGVFMF